MPPAPAAVANGELDRADDPGTYALRAMWRLALLSLPAVAIAPLLCEYAYRRGHSGRASLLFDFLTLVAGGAVVASVTTAIRKTAARGLTLVPPFALAAVLFSAIQWVAINPQPSPDFITYEKAATAMLTGGTPYPEYTYPPPFAQTLGYAERLLRPVAPSVFGPDAAWRIVFFGYAVLQLVLAGAVFVLLYSVMRTLGSSAAFAAAAVGAAMLVNVPLQATLAWNQANLLVLALALSALLVMDHSAPLAGLATTAGAMIKVYPAALVPLWWMSGRKKAAGWSVAWAALFVVAYQPIDNWIGFIRFWATQSATEYPRNSDATLLNLIGNGARLAGLGSGAQPPSWVRATFAVLVLSILCWGARRIWIRHHAASPLDAAQTRRAMVVSTAELLALALLISPRVWPHQFVYALPLTMVAAAVAPAERRALVALAALLVFGFPWSEVFPAPFVRQAGVALLLFTTAPHRAPARI
jgi:hypothetical protein